MPLNYAQFIGEKINEFEIIELVGHGAMASIYKALDANTGELVALKVPDPRFAEKGDFASRFIREARAMALLEHENIVRIRAFIEYERVPILVMQYIDGKSLAQILADSSRISVDEAVAYILQICKAVDYAHSQGVIHRDLKPGNILIETSGRVFIADFGISKLLAQNAYEETLTLVGTPLYMSPEQCGEGALDSRTDIYSLGVIFYEMLYGKPPFTGENPAEIIRRHLLEPPKFPKEAATPPKIIKIIRKMLSKDPANRYASIKEVAADLAVQCENAPATSTSNKIPLLLCHVPQRMLLNAVTSALGSASCSFEVMPRVYDLMSRLQGTEVDAVVLGAESGDSTIYTITQEIRKKNQNPRLRIILVNQGISREEVQKAFCSGVHYIIAEPFNPSVFVSKLESILQGEQKTLESRRFLRVPLSGKITMRVQSEVIDISEGGMKIMTNMPLKTGETINFELDPLRILSLGEKMGKVMWISGNDTGDAYSYQAGIDFVNLTDSERTRLRKWIFETRLQPQK